jgi:hypothetical protein
VLTLRGRSIRVYPRVFGLPRVSGFTPDIPGLKAVTTIFWVRGYKSPLTPSFTLSLAISTCKPSDLIYSLLYSPWLKFGEIVVGDLRGIESKILESASELISHL